MPRFTQIAGTGGIGTGILFQFENDKPIGRNESRLATLSPARDYCKQHIILHYIATVLSSTISVHAIGMVGDDAPGKSLLDEMQLAGIDTRLVASLRDAPTMFSACMQYSDKCVCNVTSGNSACARVTPAYIVESLKMLPAPVGRDTMLLAAPEVPFDARRCMLKTGKRENAFTIASFAADEAGMFLTSHAMQDIDLLAVNGEEAAALCGCDDRSSERILDALIPVMTAENPDMMLIMTCGAEGSLCWHEGKTQRIPALPVPVATTAGAGDAYLAGAISGLILGLPFLSEEGFSAVMLGAYFASESVQDINTITRNITREKVFQYLERKCGYV